MREKKISNKRFSMLPYQVTAFDIGTASADGCTDSSGVLEYRSIAETNQSSFRHLITLILHRDLSEGLASLWQIPRGFLLDYNQIVGSKKRHFFQQVA